MTDQHGAMSPDALKAAGAALRAARGRRRLSTIAKTAGLTETHYEDIEVGEIPGTKGRPGRPVRATVDDYTRAAQAVGLDPLRLLDLLGISHTTPEYDMTPDLMAFANMLKKRRIELGMSQIALAAATPGLSHASLSKYEQGEYLPAPSTVDVVARTYRLPVAAVRAAVAATQQARNAVDLQLPMKYARLTPKAMQALYAHADYLLSLQEQQED